MCERAFSQLIGTFLSLGTFLAAFFVTGLRDEGDEEENAFLRGFGAPLAFLG